MNFLSFFGGGAGIPTTTTTPFYKQNTNVLGGKERDNTWLQLPVCPNLIRKSNDNYSVQRECESDSKCRTTYGHPPSHVLENVLASGYIVCCQSYIYATFGPGTNQERTGCIRGEATCKYYHPPEHLALLVMNAGRTNKRIKNEFASRFRMGTNPLSTMVPAPAPAVPANNLLSLNPALAAYSMPTVYQPQSQMPNTSVGQSISSVRPLPTATSLQRPQIQTHQTIMNYATGEPLPPGTQQQNEDDSSNSQVVTRRKRQISPSEAASGISPEPKRRSLVGAPNEVPQPLAAGVRPAESQDYLQRVYHQGLPAPNSYGSQSFYFPNPYVPQYHQPGLFLLQPQAQPQLYYPYDPLLSTYLTPTL